MLRSATTLVCSVALVALLTPLVLTAQTQYSHGDPTPEEQYMLELINRARANPEAEGVRVMDTEDARVQSAYQFFNIDKTATKAAFKTYPSRPPLAFHPDLMTAARDHTTDMVQNNFQGHTGSDGSSLQERYQRVGYQSVGLYGENVSAYSESVWFGHCGLIVDWGEQNQIELGHRRNLLNFDSQVYTEIGIGITKTNGGLQQGTVGPYVITQDFGIRNVKYITGVVYDDKNNNDFYDVGEGMAGVKVETSSSDFYAVTSTSGGYAIPYSGSGQVTVTASGGGLGAPISIPIIMGSESFKLDFSPTDEPPAKVTLLSPANETTDLPSLAVEFDWEPAAFAARYELQVSRDQSFDPTSIVYASGSNTIGDDATIPDCGVTYYWRVRGTNDVGNGPWSDVFTFAVEDNKPQPPTISGPIGPTDIELGAVVPFRWEAVSGSSEYRLRIYNSNGELKIDSTVGTTTLALDLVDVINAVGAGNEFSWRVAAKGTCSFGFDSDPSTVVIAVTSVDEHAATTIGISVHPHPATPNSTLSFSTAIPGRYKVSVINTAGVAVRVSTITVHSGQGSLPALFEGVTPGAYVVVIQGPQDVQRLSVIVRG